MHMKIVWPSIASLQLQQHNRLGCIALAHKPAMAAANWVAAVYRQKHVISVHWASSVQRHYAA
jgi:hypothetical protein